MHEPSFRWACPDGGPNVAAKEFVGWAVAQLGAAPRILCHPADLPLLQATFLAPRVTTPQSGIVQRGTVWLASDPAAV